MCLLLRFPVSLPLRRCQQCFVFFFLLLLAHFSIKFPLNLDLFESLPVSLLLGSGLLAEFRRDDDLLLGLLGFLLFLGALFRGGGFRLGHLGLRLHLRLLLNIFVFIIRAALKHHLFLVSLSIETFQFSVVRVLLLLLRVLFFLLFLALLVLFFTLFLFFFLALLLCNFPDLTSKPSRLISHLLLTINFRVFAAFEVVLLFSIRVCVIFSH